MDDWMVELHRGKYDAAWDLFINGHRRVIFAAIHHYARDPDDVADIFAWVCEVLRANDLERLRRYTERSGHTARFTTWLVTVVRHLAVDWFRHRDGRRQRPVISGSLTPLQRRICELVYVDDHSHVAAYELIRGSMAPGLSFTQFLGELRIAHEIMSGHRGQALHAFMSQMPEGPSAQPPSTGETAERRAVLDEAVHSLATAERRVVDLYVIDGRPAATVATMLGLADAKAVYNRVYRALTVLRERLEKAGIRRGDL
ncbi:MAG TPA: sigma-70 family RNA polymerase sigma factor [Gemmatimonadaceae bacterium]|nr:sigma-70 family RNA polymerase sigma factor [Gemmatimonadaceae bacterium]